MQQLGHNGDVLFGCSGGQVVGDGKDEAAPEMAPRAPQEVDGLSVDEMRRIVFEAGIVGLGGAMFPTHIKLAPPHPVENFILNGAECEPYLTADYRLMVERADDLARGIKWAMKMLGARRCFIAIEDDKPEAIKAMRERARMFHWDVVVLKTAYPQGGEKQVIKSCLKREVPPESFLLISASRCRTSGQLLRSPRRSIFESRFTSA